MFFVIFLLLYMVFKSAAVAAVLIFPILFAMSGGLILQWVLGYNFSVAVWVGYIALFGIAVETGVVMVVYLHEALQNRLATSTPLTEDDVEQATIEGAVQRLRPKLMTVTAVILSLAPILWESGIGSDVMKLKPIAAPIVGGMITSTIHALILVPVFLILNEAPGPAAWHACETSKIKVNRGKHRMHRDLTLDCAPDCSICLWKGMVGWSDGYGLQPAHRVTRQTHGDERGWYPVLRKTRTASQSLAYRRALPPVRRPRSGADSLYPADAGARIFSERDRRTGRLAWAKGGGL